MPEGIPKSKQSSGAENKVEVVPISSPGAVINSAFDYKTQQRRQEERRQEVIKNVVPQVGDRVSVTKISVKPGKSTTGIKPGESFVSTLKTGIVEDEAVHFTNGAHTGSLRAAEVRGSTVIVETDSSIYKIEKI